MKTIQYTIHTTTIFIKESKCITNVCFEDFVLVLTPTVSPERKVLC